MAITAQEPLTEVKALLNDPDGNIYPDARVIPFMQKAYRELQTKMMLNGLPVLKESSVDIPVAAGTLLLGDGSGLPTDFIYPIELHERVSGSTDRYEEMKELAWEGDYIPSDRLLYWNWREEEVKFAGATTPREVRIRYMKGLARITGVGSNIAVNNAVSFLATRTASLAARFLGSNPTRADALDGDAGMALSDLLGILVKRDQGLGIRRRVNRYRR